MLLLLLLLLFIDQVASGAAGAVWKASYITDTVVTVAAKQLQAMSDIVSIEEPLLELVNEVRCRKLRLEMIHS